jgi:hypothetical protein
VSIAICLILHSDVNAMEARLSEIRKIGFSPVYVFLDGVGSDASENVKAGNQKIRDEISKLRREGVIEEIFLSHHNLGVGAGILCAVDWFFSQENFGIILEDDCQIGASAHIFAKNVLLELTGDDLFGGFCLTKYSLDPNIYGIRSAHGTSFFQSWGWGTSAEVWKKFRSANLSQVTKTSLFKRLSFLPLIERGILTQILWKEFLLVRAGRKNLWAVLFTVFLIQNQLRLSLPVDNVVLHLPRSYASNVTQMPKWYRSMTITNRLEREMYVGLSIQKQYELMLARNVYGASLSRVCISLLLKLPFLSRLRTRTNSTMKAAFQ